MDIRHIMAQLGIDNMKYVIFSTQQFLADYKRLPFIQRTRRTHDFINRELPHILQIMIEEEKKNEHTTFD